MKSLHVFDVSKSWHRWLTLPFLSSTYSRLSTWNPVKGMKCIHSKFAPSTLKLLWYISCFKVTNNLVCRHRVHNTASRHRKYQCKTSLIKNLPVIKKVLKLNKQEWLPRFATGWAHIWLHDVASKCHAKCEILLRLLTLRWREQNRSRFSAARFSSSPQWKSNLCNWYAAAT